ncbi:hypothetical protein OG401_14405 [Kitasatospora purpeofusca]|uniref:hypothetical protein n=1 Tax=Kitasatospora purpeofusca TaxID=67352 RepID=UPI0022536BBF|nr:hypothetical protein [Kitasatospora purpeofusca]MCX4685491.1 hypothetical protein [Kitasatospora purpeofusca]
MNRLNPEEGADALGIADEHRASFLAMVDALRTPEARDAELARLRKELGAIDDALIEAGIQHPLGARGVRDLAEAYKELREGADEDDE